jgi:L-serine dehydratase
VGSCSRVTRPSGLFRGETAGEIPPTKSAFRESAYRGSLRRHLVMTCDPVAGLVQIPGIERNAVGAVKAVTALRLALAGDGTHKVTLDQVIETMRRTAAEMGSWYKDTSLGGLAVNVTRC